MKDKPSKYVPDLLRGSTDTLLLFLIQERHAYGYQLIKEIERRSHGYFRFKEGTVYPALHRLENEDFLEGEWQELPNGQVRRYYRITEKGKYALREKMATWRDFTSAVNLVFRPMEA